MRQRGIREIAGPVRAQVFFGDTAEEGAQEIRGEFGGTWADLARGARDYLFNERESRRGDLAKHLGETLRK